jgi:outer membrane immunogenic protein
MGSVVFFAHTRPKVVPTRELNKRRNSGALEYRYESTPRAPNGTSVKRGTVMRKRSLMLLAVATIGLVASQASAADMPRKAPPAAPPPPPPITWTGCYIGANVGGIFSRREADFGFGFGDLSTNNSGFAGGGQIGCDYQFAGGWVLGFRNMFDGTSLHRERTFFDPVTLNSATVDFHNNWFDALTGRIGYSITPGWLWYFQGGAVWAKNSADVTINGFDFGSVSRTRTGWTVGGGVEWMFTRGWSAFLEGNYMDFGSHDRTLVTPLVPLCAAGCAFSTKATAATVLVGVNYRFGGWGY